HRPPRHSWFECVARNVGGPLVTVVSAHPPFWVSVLIPCRLHPRAALNLTRRCQHVADQFIHLVRACCECSAAFLLGNNGPTVLFQLLICCVGYSSHSGTSVTGSGGVSVNDVICTPHGPQS